MKKYEAQLILLTLAKRIYAQQKERLDNKISGILTSDIHKQNIIDLGEAIEIVEKELECQDPTQ